MRWQTDGYCLMGPTNKLNFYFSSFEEEEEEEECLKQRRKRGRSGC